MSTGKRSPQRMRIPTGSSGRSVGRYVPSGRPGRGPSGPPWWWFAVGGAGLVLIVGIVLLAILLPRGNGPVTTPTASRSPGVTVAVPTGPISPTVETPTGTTLPPTATPVAIAPDVPALQQMMLDLVNADRAANGLSRLAWDSTAAQAGQNHAQEMAQFGYLSHWDLAGNGPDHRYTAAGGLDAVQENAYQYTHSSSLAPTSPGDWQELIRQAEDALMNSPGHRANILAPEHTHLGVGIAYDAASGTLAITQEFVNHYVALSPLPQQAAVGQRIVVRGRLEAGASEPLLEIAYEPFPTARGLAELTPQTYTSLASGVETFALTPADNGGFEIEILLDNPGQPGLYHVRIWVQTAQGQMLANDVVARVQ